MVGWLEVEEYYLLAVVYWKKGSTARRLLLLSVYNVGWLAAVVVDDEGKNGRRKAQGK